VNTAPLVAAVHKQHKALDFNPTMVEIIKDITGLNEDTYQVMTHGLASDDGFLLGFNRALQQAVAPGAGLDLMILNATQSFLNSLDTMRNGGARRVSMYSWIRGEVLVATTDAVYGPKNPFRDPAVATSWQ
jgi:hypothetical protein